MTYNTIEQIKKRIADGRPEKGISAAIQNYLTGQAYDAWVADGNAPEDFEAETPYEETWEIKLLRKPLYKAEQSAKLAEGCPSSLGFTVDCNPSNVADFTSTLVAETLAESLGIGSELIKVKDFNNVEHFLTFAEYKTLCLELAVHVRTLREAYWEDSK